MSVKFKVVLKYVRASFQVYSASAGREGEDPDVHRGHVQVQGEEEEKETEKSGAANCCHFIVISCFCTTLHLSFRCNQLFLYNLSNYSVDLNSGLVRYCNGRKQSFSLMVRYSDHNLNNGQNCLLFRYHLNK